MLRSLVSSRAVYCRPWHTLLSSQRLQSSAQAVGVVGATSTNGSVSLDDVLALWNEGNLFSLSVQQMQEFLQGAGVPLPQSSSPTMRKASLVRRVEEYLNAKEAAAASTPASSSSSPAGGRLGEYGKWDRHSTPPATLLDLAQSGFYDGAANLVPKAFQLLPTGSSAEMTVSRVNTSAFPGFPANTECYTLTATAADVAVQSRFSRVLQWCFLNMSNLQMDGELCMSLGKLVLHKQAMYRNEEVVSAYTLQQRLQLTHPYTWVTTVPESAIPRVEALLEAEGFHPVKDAANSDGASAATGLVYEGHVKRAKDVLEIVMGDKGQIMDVKADWVNVQTTFHTNQKGADVRTILRTRPPVAQSELDAWRKTTAIQLADDDVTDVLPAEMGQLVYLSENQVRRFEKVNHFGITLTVTEIKRQPLIVVKDEEEDPRVEYMLSVFIPASAGSQNAQNVRGVGLELLDLAERLASSLTECFAEAYGC